MAYTPKDFQYDTPPRIMGSETEYNLQFMTDECDLRPFVDKYYREDGRDDGRELWLPNGSRFYIDSGGLVEYATPEVTSAHQLLAYERAGEQSTQRVAAGMDAAIADRPSGKAATYKRSGYCLPGHDRETAGHHENYATSIPVASGNLGYQYHPIHKALNAYLSTRGIWAGAGIAAENTYELTQKHTTISFSATSKTTREGSKPAYMIHDERSLNRLEIRLGDGNMSDWAIIQKYAFTSLVLRMIEHGSFPSHLLLPLGKEDSERTFYITSRNHLIRTRDNKRMHPAKHQRMIAEAALEFAEGQPYTPHEEIDAAKEIVEACHQLEMIDHSLEGAELLADRVDWAAKLTMLREGGYIPNERTFKAIYDDLRWEDVAVDGLARTWYDKRQSRAVDSAAIELAAIAPPATRAMARTAILDELSDHPSGIIWHRIEGPEGYHVLNDPYDPSAA